MKIAQLKVRIGQHEAVITNCSDEEDDVVELMRLARHRPQHHQGSSAEARTALN